MGGPTPEDKKRKITKPWAVALANDRLFSFGGIWDRWKDRATGNVLESFAIVTVDPNEVLEPFHNRSPLILEPKEGTPHETEIYVRLQRVDVMFSIV